MVEQMDILEVRKQRAGRRNRLAGERLVGDGVGVVVVAAVVVVKSDVDVEDVEDVGAQHHAGVVQHSWSK